MNIAVVQSRMASKRLPGKALLNIGGQPLICHVIKRGQMIKGIEKVVLATSKGDDNDLLTTFAGELGIDVFRGDEDDVLGRFYNIAKENKAENVVRLTGDNPFIDPKAFSFLLDKHICAGNDYTCYKGMPVGAVCDIFSMKAIEESYKNADGKELCDHVDLFILENQDKFKLERYDLEKDLSSYRFTVDDPKDLEVARNLVDGIKENSREIDISTLNIIDLISFAEKIQIDKDLRPLYASVSERNRYTAELEDKISSVHRVSLDEIYG